MNGLNLAEVLQRVVKYVIEGFAVALAAHLITSYSSPKKSLRLDEVAMLGLTAAAVYALLDMYVPAVGATARAGSGFGIGANLVGFPM